MAERITCYANALAHASNLAPDEVKRLEQLNHWGWLGQSLLGKRFGLLVARRLEKMAGYIPGPEEIVGSGPDDLLGLISDNLRLGNAVIFEERTLRGVHARAVEINGTFESVGLVESSGRSEWMSADDLYGRLSEQRNEEHLYALLKKRE